MRKLIFVRHCQSQPQPGVPSSQWPLSIEAEQRCRRLATLRSYDPVIIVSSAEVKALQTAQVLAELLTLPVDTLTSLHEHERTGAPFLGRKEFLSTMRKFFHHSQEQIFGNETAAQALQRFSSAVDTITTSYPEGNLIVVSHGTVLSLFVAHHTGQDPFAFWQRLGQPAYVVFEHPSFTLAEAVFTV